MSHDLRIKQPTSRDVNSQNCCIVENLLPHAVSLRLFFTAKHYYILILVSIMDSGIVIIPFCVGVRGCWLASTFELSIVVIGKIWQLISLSWNTTGPNFISNYKLRRTLAFSCNLTQRILKPDFPFSREAATTKQELKVHTQELSSSSY